MTLCDQQSMSHGEEEKTARNRGWESPVQTRVSPDKKTPIEKELVQPGN